MAAITLPDDRFHLMAFSDDGAAAEETGQVVSSQFGQQRGGDIYHQPALVNFEDNPTRAFTGWCDTSCGRRA